MESNHKPDCLINTRKQGTVHCTCMESKESKSGWENEFDKYYSGPLVDIGKLKSFIFQELSKARAEIEEIWHQKLAGYLKLIEKIKQWKYDATHE